VGVPVVLVESAEAAAVRQPPQRRVLGLGVRHATVRHFTHSWALEESSALRINVLSVVKISKAFGIFLPCLDTLTLLMEPTSNA